MFIILQPTGFCTKNKHKFVDKISSVIINGKISGQINQLQNSVVKSFGS